MNYFQITIAVPDPVQQDILVALLTDLGYDGFEHQEESLLAFHPESTFDPVALAATLGAYNLAYGTALLPDKNWNEEWERNFVPVQVGRFCAVRAHFHLAVSGVVHDLVITPKMSFGTGHHATTYMMLQAMEHLDFKNKTVLDFGTGTGVLAILAEKLGAARVTAIDNDDWCIGNARENIKENHCINVSIRKSDGIKGEGQFDIILANINKHILLSAMSDMGQQLRSGGVILMSGLLSEDFEEIENQALNFSLSLTERTTKGGWICLKMEKSPN